MPEKFLSIASTGEKRLRGTLLTSHGSTDANKVPSTRSDGILDESLLPSYPLSLLQGMSMARNGTSKINFYPGVAAIDCQGVTRLAKFNSILIKNLASTWVAGLDVGGRFVSTAVAANQTWHCFVIRNRNTQAIDFGFDTSPVGANAPIGWDARILGSIMTDSTGAIRSFAQVGNKFLWSPEVQDYRSSITSTGNSITISVPTGVNNLEAIIRVASGSPVFGSDAAILVSSVMLSQPTVGRQGNGSATVECGYTTNYQFEQSAVDTILVGNTGQVRVIATANTGFANLPRIATLGFIHPRGQY